MIMKVRALHTIHGKYGLKKAGEVFDVSEEKFKDLTEKRKREGKRPLVAKVHKGFSGRKTKPDFPTDYKYERNGSWYTVYRGDEQVDKFQGKEGLKKYGLYES